FRNYAEAFPAASAVLIDTYDSLAAARKVVELAREGVNIGAVRIDSGDLAAQARAVRALFDAAGLAATRILASGDLDEYRLRELEAAAAPIDGYGVGTRMNTSMDAPALDMVYKLQEYAGRPCGKRSPQKSTLPGRKQVFRRLGPDDRLAGDTLALEDAALCGERLLQPVMRAGRMLEPAPGLAALREHAARQLARLPQPLRDLDAAPAYRVEIDAGLQAMAAGVPVQAPRGATGGRS
ncbi:MAG: nicotinate phosphoribosyltransferase, partial [Rhodocyclaceae bacterium]|nr:nicotinate phosphoribosyltransferase [Rhodocyclaceae bacterium]